MKPTVSRHQHLKFCPNWGGQRSDWGTYAMGGGATPPSVLGGTPGSTGLTPNCSANPLSRLTWWLTWWLTGVAFSCVPGSLNASGLSLPSSLLVRLSSLLLGYQITPRPGRLEHRTSLCRTSRGSGPWPPLGARSWRSLTRKQEAGLQSHVKARGGVWGSVSELTPVGVPMSLSPSPGFSTAWLMTLGPGPLGRVIPERVRECIQDGDSGLHITQRRKGHPIPCALLRHQEQVPSFSPHSGAWAQAGGVPGAGVGAAHRRSPGCFCENPRSKSKTLVHIPASLPVLGWGQ